MKAGWTEVALGDVADINPRLGATVSGDQPVAFVPMAAVDAVAGSVVAQETRLAGDLSPGLTPFVSGDVLVAKITPCFENGKIAHALTEPRIAFGSTEFHVIRGTAKADQRYLFHFLRQDRIRFAGEQRMTGSAGQRRVPAAFLQQLALPLPPLPEQRRIAAILDAAAELRAKRRASLALLDSLADAIFLDMFGDPVTNPMNWPARRVLGDIADAASGITKGRKTPDQTLRMVPYLAVANVQDRHLRLDAVKTIEASEAEIARYRLVPGDLLLTEGGDPDKLGRGTVWSGEIEDCIHQNHIFRVRINHDDFEPYFVSRLIASERGRRYFLRSAKQTTGIASINMSQLKEFPLIEPAAHLQREYVGRMSAAAETVRLHEEHRRTLDALFASLQHRAFRGEL